MGCHEDVTPYTHPVICVQCTSNDDLIDVITSYMTAILQSAGIYTVGNLSSLFAIAGDAAAVNKLSRILTKLNMPMRLVRETRCLYTYCLMLFPDSVQLI